MIFLELQPRIIENKDWATALFLISFALVVFSKNLFETRFYHFARLLISDKYTKIYRENNAVVNGFTLLLFFTNIISLSFFIQLVFHHIGYGSKTDWVLFIQIATFLMVFILSKYLIEKIIATTFGLEDLIEAFNLQKVNYRTYLGMLLLPLTGILYYNDFLSNSLIFTIIAILLIINLLTYIISLKNFQNLILSKMFYFILYLCALEIAPYYFLYYLVTKQ